MTWWEKALLGYLAASVFSVGWLWWACDRAPIREDWR